VSENPFLSNSALNLPLQPDICQQMHFTALQAVVNSPCSDALPPHLSNDELRRRRRIQGGEACLAHPAHVEQVFSGVTLSVYQAIEELFCQRLGRNVHTVWCILEKMATQADSPAVKYEAVWSICQYLQERRQANADTTVEHTESTWQLIQICPDVIIQDMNDVYRPTILCVLDTSALKVLSFRITHDPEIEETAALTLYDAIESKRRPSPNGSAGLIWQLPLELATEVGLTSSTEKALNQLGIDTVPDRSTTLPFVDTLRSGWDKDLTGRDLQKNRFVMIFDNYLQKVHGYGPMLERKYRDRDFTHLIGYNRDPAWQFPALRQFLPQRSGLIDQAGAVEYNNLHYEDELLAYWPGNQVALRRSQKAEAVAWIYLDEEILCQATARELRRKDGSYRPNRPGRD
jgi:hypothetical protein